MRATLSFTLPREASEHNDALNGSRWRSALDDVAQRLRSRLKYGPGECTDPEFLADLYRDVCALVSEIDPDGG